MTTDLPLFRCEDICFAYENLIALNHISFDIQAGETVIFSGPNGCGKSTLMRLLNGLIFPQEGHFYFDQDEITEKKLSNNSFSKEFHQRIGFIFQNSDIQLFCGSVKDEIEFGPLQMGLSKEEVQKRYEDVVSLLDIEHLTGRAPYHLSGGEKRKVAIACILSMNPEVLILDEPLAGLDKKSQEWLTEFLLTLKKSGKTMLISTHHDGFANLLADRTIIMNDDHKIERIC